MSSSKEGKAEYKKFLEAVANDGLGYALSNYPPDYAKLGLYNNTLSIRIMNCAEEFRKLENEIFNDMDKFGVEY